MITLFWDKLLARVKNAFTLTKRNFTIQLFIVLYMLKNISYYLVHGD